MKHVAPPTGRSSFCICTMSCLTAVGGRAQKQTFHLGSRKLGSRLGPSNFTRYGSRVQPLKVASKSFAFCCSFLAVRWSSYRFWISPCQPSALMQNLYSKAHRIAICDREESIVGIVEDWRCRPRVISAVDVSHYNPTVHQLAGGRAEITVFKCNSAFATQVAHRPNPQVRIGIPSLPSL